MPTDIELQIENHIEKWLEGRLIECPVCGVLTEEGNDCPDKHYEKFQNVKREFSTYPKAIVYLRVI